MKFCVAASSGVGLNVGVTVDTLVNGGVSDKVGVDAATVAVSLEPQATTMQVTIKLRNKQGNLKNTS